MKHMPTVEELNQRFVIFGAAEIHAGHGGLPCIRINTSQASAEIYLHGAHLTSWRPAGAEEVIFVSQHAEWETGKAIRGGIPVCFPWFRDKQDDPNAPWHGLVRTKEWQLDNIVRNGENVFVSLSTASDASTRKWWPRDFELSLRITVGAQLTQELVMRNTSAEPIRFEEALHTYYRVGSAESIKIRGLEGVGYFDNTDNYREKKQEGDIAFSGPTDRAYFNTTHSIEMADPVLRRRILITKHGSRSTVVWNPWSSGAQKMADLGDDEWRVMTCVEAANMRACAVDLGPGKEHVMKTVASVTALPDDHF